MKRFLAAGAGLAALGVAGGALAQAAIRAGETVTGTLNASDPKADDGTPYDLYAYRGTPGDRVRITMEAAGFDAYLAAGTRAAPDCPADCRTDDDGGGGTNAALTTTVPAGGLLQIRANAISENSFGAYTLRVAALPAAPRPTTRPLTIGTPLNAALGDASPRTTDNMPFQLFTLKARPGERLTLRLNAENFDPVVAVGAFTGGVFTESASDDDGGPGTNARLNVEVPASGELVIQTRALSSDATGDFTLLAEPRRTQPPLRVQAVSVGDAVRGALDVTDSFTEEDEAAFDLYAIKGRPGQRVVVRMESGAFDTVLSWGVLEGGAFQEEMRNDDDSGAGGTNSRLVVTLDEAGVGVLRATSLDGALGAYTLSFVSAPPPAR